MKQNFHLNFSPACSRMPSLKINKRILSFLFIILFICTLAFFPLSSEAQDPLLPYSVKVKGDIVDNYANFTYELRFNNTASAEATEISWFFKVQEGIRLSNISVSLSDLVY